MMLYSQSTFFSCAMFSFSFIAAYELQPAAGSCEAMLKILKILEDLNKFCPTEIWSTDRLQLAANILDQLPANIEAGTYYGQKPPSSQ